MWEARIPEVPGRALRKRGRAEKSFPFSGSACHGSGLAGITRDNPGV